jgi:hypothetical protein
MGWWGTIAGALLGRREKGEPKTVVEEATTGIINGIDAAWFTDEEKAAHSLKVFELKAKAVEAHADFVKNTASENSARSIARREIALMVIKVWLSMTLLTVPVAVFDKVAASTILDVVKAYGLPTAVLMVLGFYFSLYALDKIKAGWGK